MDEESLLNIRETSRNQLVLNRRKHRDEVADCRRSMNNLRINPGTVMDISNKLKTKSSVSLAELQTLKNALIDNAANMEVVFNTHGAIRGLVREFTGTEVNKQCAAAGCLCNLALADSRGCMVIAKAAGTYLISTLDNLTTELAITSAWTLGNLAGSGPKACEFLAGQGAIYKLVELIGESYQEVVEAVVYALVHFVYQMKDDLSPDRLQKILQSVPRLRTEYSSQMLFILSCHDAFPVRFISENLVIRMLQYVHLYITKSKDQNVDFIFRTFANFNSEAICYIVFNYFFEYNMENLVKKLVENDNEAVLWFLGNAYKICRDKSVIEKLLK